MSYSLHNVPGDSIGGQVLAIADQPDLQAVLHFHQWLISAKAGAKVCKRIRDVTQEEQSGVCPQGRFTCSIDGEFCLNA